MIAFLDFYRKNKKASTVNSSTSFQEIRRLKNDFKLVASQKESLQSTVNLLEAQKVELLKITNHLNEIALKQNEAIAIQRIEIISYLKSLNHVN